MRLVCENTRTNQWFFFFIPKFADLKLLIANYLLHINYAYKICRKKENQHCNTRLL